MASARTLHRAGRRMVLGMAAGGFVALILWAKDFF
jgi:hypothetical protein